MIKMKVIKDREVICHEDESGTSRTNAQIERTIRTLFALNRTELRCVCGNDVELAKKTCPWCGATVDVERMTPEEVEREYGKRPKELDSPLVSFWTIRWAKGEDDEQ